MTRLCPLHLLLIAAAAASASGADEAHVSIAVAEKGLAFAKDVLISEAVRSLTPLRLPGVEKAVRVPFLGGIRVAASNITLFHLDVGDNSTIFPGDSGLLVVASGITANISMHWSYCYDSWLFPIEITDSGTASILVQGMEVGITMVIKNKNGSLALSVSQCGCYVKDLVISLDGGASWFYQGFINAFEDHIKAAVEKAVPENIIEGAGKLDSFLQGLPRTISLDDVAAFNLTFINDPHYGNSSIEFDINGLITSAVAETANLQKHPQLSLACGGASKMLLLSLDEDVFNSALEVHFKSWTTP
uniref:Lipid-binding serum glycoprotein N-terminal domain-containing protein n=1 Tax=Zea mays TaxID=4577 RepID=A0A804R2A3_MAIZE